MYVNELNSRIRIQEKKKEKQEMVTTKGACFTCGGISTQNRV